MNLLLNYSTVTWGEKQSWGPINSSSVKAINPDRSGSKLFSTPKYYEPNSKQTLKIIWSLAPRYIYISCPESPFPKIYI